MIAVDRLARLGFARGACGVWSRDEGGGIPYGDGAEALLERYVDGDHAALDSVPEELRWPLLYHLSPGRRALLDPLDLGGRVLELGAGMGALTGRLLEGASEVVAVEGAAARARVLRKRDRDEARLEVVRADLLALPFEGEFDVVTSIGVLEYAGAFAPAASRDEAARRVLAACARFLRPGGGLVLAIENAFGAKYWAGCHEDHVGVPFAGIEGYDGVASGVRTYARDELCRMVAEAGLEVRALHGCWPDYKFPAWLVDADAPREQVARLVTEWGPAPCLDRPATRLLRERAFLAAAARSDLLGYLWNSYLLLAVKR
jgi:SAM-dependent methyltransferase